jgi:mono/diheme cytochrome c family protein
MLSQVWSWWQRSAGDASGRRAIVVPLSALALIAADGGCNPVETSSHPATPVAASPVGAGAVAGASPGGAAERSGPDDARGGRLYDNWRVEKGVSESFVPDASSTPALDGKGGPNSNGTINDGNGRPLPNTGHDYRLKNLFGWDLRGSDGIYGAAFQHKPFVLGRNLLTDTRSTDELRSWLARGDESMPAFGQVLDDADLDDVVAYLEKTRARQLAGPASIFSLDAQAPKNYVLARGGNVERGRERYAISCADCHGTDGRNLPIDETESLGTLSRSSAYEVWFKMLNGQPGTDMRRQILDPGAAAQEQAILDVLAALCDRGRFPAMDGQKDVPDADPRCADYLK